MTGEKLGDRLTGAKLIIDALGAKSIDAEQAERLLDGLLPPPAPIVLESPQMASNGQMSVLEMQDHRERLEREQEDPRTQLQTMASGDLELQEAIEEDLERSKQPPNPPPAPGTNLLDDPEDFVARAAAAKRQKAQNSGTKHR